MEFNNPNNFPTNKGFNNNSNTSFNNQQNSQPQVKSKTQTNQPQYNREQLSYQTENMIGQNPQSFNPHMMQNPGYIIN